MTGLLRALRPARAAEAQVVFPPARQPLLLALADVIVPRAGDSPAASEIDLLPQLESWIARSGNARLYDQGWPRLEAVVRAEVRFAGSQPEPKGLHALCARWFAEYVAPGRPSLPAIVFEQLRWDVLTLYYASPAGRAFVGDPGRGRFPSHYPGAAA